MLIEHCSRHVLASVGICTFVEVALSARLDILFQFVPLEPPFLTKEGFKSAKCWIHGESGLKCAGFQGGGKRGEIGHCNQVGRMAPAPGYFRPMPASVGLDTLHPKSNPISKAQMPCHGRVFPTLS